LGIKKWFEYEAQVLIPYISNGPLISWMYPVFGIRGASWFLGVSEWLFGALLFSGFWNKKLGILGALGSCVTFIMTVTWLGCVCRRVSSNGGQRSFPHEGCGSLCRISLFAEAGCTEGLTFHQT
jgi:uncharacterized membrane protein YkgB